MGVFRINLGCAAVGRQGLVVAVQPREDLAARIVGTVALRLELDGAVKLGERLLVLAFLHAQEGARIVLQGLGAPWRLVRPHLAGARRGEHAVQAIIQDSVHARRAVRRGPQSLVAAGLGEDAARAGLAGGGVARGELDGAVKDLLGLGHQAPAHQGLAAAKERLGLLLRAARGKPPLFAPRHRRGGREARI